MNVWDFLDGLIRYPPGIVVLIVIALLVGHALRIVSEFLTKRPQPNVLIASLEIIVVIVFSYVILHLYFTRELPGKESTSSTSEALVLACLLVFFTILSMIIYLLFRLAVQERDNER